MKSKSIKKEIIKMEEKRGKSINDGAKQEINIRLREVQIWHCRNVLRKSTKFQCINKEK